MLNRTNILNWYQFKNQANVLEIYEDESILEKKENIQLTTVQMEQITNKLEDLNTFDYITLIGTYEYAPRFCNEGEEEPYVQLLKKLKQHLKENGTILLAIDNRFGIKYFVGGKSKHYNNLFESIESGIRKDKPNLLSKKEIEQYIKKAGYENSKFYYPLPDYQNTNSIYTDAFLPKYNHSKIVYPLNYEEESSIVYNENNAIKQLCNQNRFVEFANSYLVEVSDSPIKNDIKFVNYNIMRKDKYRLELTIKEDSAEKIARTDEAKQHVNNIEKYTKELMNLGFEIKEHVENGKIISPFIKEEELDKIIIKSIKQYKKEEAYNEIENWYEYICAKLLSQDTNKIEGKNIFEKYEIEIPEEITQKMHFTKFGYIDLSFENVFYKDNRYLFYDQEWYFENIPVEFILFRAIRNLYSYNEIEITKVIPKEEMLKRFQIQDKVEYLEILEKIIQNEILDSTKVEEYKNDILKYFKNIKVLENEAEIQKENVIELENKILVIQKQKEEVEKKYNLMKQDLDNSKGWKMITGIRKMLGRK